MTPAEINNKRVYEKNVLIIKDAMILPMDASGSFIEQGDLLIIGDRIKALGTLTNLKSSYPHARVINGKGKLIMPGLINLHTHVPMTLFRGYADDLPLHEWLYDYIFPIEAAFITPRNVRYGSILAVAEMLRSGTTTFNDMYYYVDDIAEVVDKTGIRGVLSESVIDFAAPNNPTPEHCLKLGEELHQKWLHHPRITVSFSAHAIYSTSEKYIQQAYELAGRYNVPFNIHLAETRKEFDDMMTREGITPTAWLEKIGVLGSNTIGAHGVHLTEKDIEIVASRGVSIAHNPECNMKLASGVAPIPQMLKAGVKVGFGTDGVASNNNMDLFEEMNSAAILHKLISKDPTTLDARTVVEMATIGGARALGMDHEIGSLEPGKKADLIVLDMMQPHAHPVYNIYSLVVYSLQGSDVESVIIDGEWVMENKKLTHFDETSLYSTIEDIARQIRDQGLNVNTRNKK